MRELYILYDNAVKAKHGQYHLWLYVAKVSFLALKVANLGWMYVCDFYTIFRECYFEYILSKTVTKIGGHQVFLEATVRNISSNHN